MIRFGSFYRLRTPLGRKLRSWAGRTGSLSRYLDMLSVPKFTVNLYCLCFAVVVVVPTADISCCYGQTHLQRIIAVGGDAIVFVVDTVVGAIVGFFPAKIAAAAVIDIYLYFFLAVYKVFFAVF